MPTVLRAAQLTALCRGVLVVADAAHWMRYFALRRSEPAAYASQAMLGRAMAVSQVSAPVIALNVGVLDFSS